MVIGLSCYCSLVTCCLFCWAVMGICVSVAFMPLFGGGCLICLWLYVLLQVWFWWILELSVGFVDWLGTLC